MTQLFHYTCRHQAALIGRRGTLTPHPQPLLGQPLVWLTDLPEPDAEALGLTAHTLSCDRTAVRYRVMRAPDVLTWREWAERERIPRPIRSELELGRRARHWYVSSTPVEAVAP